jgi:hypothetical protein
MQPLRAGDLSIAPHLHPSCVRLDWQGRSGARDPSQVLVPYFEEAFRTATAAQASIEMHFEDLEYFNSSTIAALIEGIRLARAAGVRMVLVYRQALRWQRMSFDALQVFVTDDLELRPV